MTKLSEDINKDNHKMYNKKFGKTKTIVMS